MKVSSNQQKFTPFSITIDIETEGEARALYAIFNLNKNSQLLGRPQSTMIKTAIGSKFYSDRYKDEINNGLNGGNYYNNEL